MGHFHGFSAALSQDIRRVCTRESTANPQVFSAFPTGFAHDFHQGFTSGFFLSLFERIPKEIADAAGEKKGEKQAVEGRVWKTGRKGVGRGKTTMGLGLRREVHRWCGTWNSRGEW